MKFRRIPIAGIAAMLAACSHLPSVGPDYRAPELALSANWSAATTEQTIPGRELAHWWRQLDDPLLDRLIDEALAASPDLRLAQARLRQARASRDLAVSGYFPTVSAAAGANRSTNTSSADQQNRTLYNAGFDVGWEIDIFGGTRRAVEAAGADLEASEANLAGTRVSLVAEVARNYIDLRSYQERLKIARENLASQSETLQIAEWRYQAGLARANEVEQARTNREQTRAGIPDLEIGLTAAKNRLAVLLGKNPGALHDELAEVRPLPPVPASVATGIPAGVLRSRPDLIAAERTLAAETARVGQALAQRFPSLNLSASFGWQAYSFGALGDPGTYSRSLIGSLAAVLFDGGRLRSQVEAQNAVQEQALVSYESSVLTALEEVENALTAYALGRERVDARSAAVVAARNAAELSRNLYQSGLADFQQVLDTERTLLSTEEGLANAEATMRTDLITLYKTLGGGWEQGSAAAAGQDTEGSPS